MDEQKPSNDIASEFAELGKNIKKALQSAWSSDERKKLQAEIENGLKQAGEALKHATSDISQTQVGKTVKSETVDFQKRVKSGELEAKVRSEVLNALRIANEQLKKAFPGGSSSAGGSDQPPDRPGGK